MQKPVKEEYVKIAKKMRMVEKYTNLKEKKERLKRKLLEVEDEQLNEFTKLVNERSREKSKKFDLELEQKRNNWPFLTKLLNAHRNAQIRTSVQRRRRRAKRAERGSTKKEDLEAKQQKDYYEKRVKKEKEEDEEKYRHIETMRMNMSADEKQREQELFAKIKDSKQKKNLDTYEEVMENIMSPGASEENYDSNTVIDQNFNHQDDGGAYCSENGGVCSSVSKNDDPKSWPMSAFDKMKKSEISRLIKLYFPDLLKKDGGVSSDQCDTSDDSDY